MKRTLFLLFSLLIGSSPLAFSKEVLPLESIPEVGVINISASKVSAREYMKILSLVDEHSTEETLYLPSHEENAALLNKLTAPSNVDMDVTEEGFVSDFEKHFGNLRDMGPVLGGLTFKYLIAASDNSAWHDEAAMFMCMLLDWNVAVLKTTGALAAIGKQQDLHEAIQQDSKNVFEGLIESALNEEKYSFELREMMSQRLKHAFSEAQPFLNESIQKSLQQQAAGLAL